MGSDPISLPHKNWNEVDPDVLREAIANNQSSNNVHVETSTNSNTNALSTNPTKASTKRRRLRFLKIVLSFLTSIPVVVILRTTKPTQCTWLSRWPFDKLLIWIKLLLSCNYNFRQTNRQTFSSNQTNLPVDFLTILGHSNITK